MKISTVQFAPKLFNLESNLDYILLKAKSIESDIIVFPELATSGYYFINREECQSMALRIDSEELRAFRDLAVDSNKILILGFAEEAERGLFNSAALFFPDNKLNHVYRKTHLFYKEYEVFEPGDTGFSVVRYPDFDISIGTMICYDWRFPEAARSLGLQSADLIVCPSNLVTPLWSRVMPARAIENKCYLAVANRIGTETRNDEQLLFNGRSTIYHYYGDELASSGADEEIVITAEIRPSATRDKSFNPINDINKDRRPEMYY